MTFEAAVDRSSQSYPSRTSPMDLSGFKAARAEAKQWADSIEVRKRQQAAWAFIKTAINEYVAELSQRVDHNIVISNPAIALTYKLNKQAKHLAIKVGRAAASLPVTEACYRLSACYTVLIPSATRSALGMYFTPSALTERLLKMATDADLNWENARVLDPACGGGAFLLPVAMKMRNAINQDSPADQLSSIASRLRGFEIDPFAAWLTQAWLEIALADLISASNKRLPPVVQICDTLQQVPNEELFDLVVGNPPYGRVSLSTRQRAKFSRSLFGHANLYGLFTDIALKWTKPNGIIAYVTPTSFLAGEYFKKLRELLVTEAPPIAIDIIDARRGIFEDVLQEALLATYRRNGKKNGSIVHFVCAASDHSVRVSHTGRFDLPLSAASPWLIPRRHEHQELIDRLTAMPNRLKDWGYSVSTGPLVWNRFKEQLRTRSSSNTFPLIWAEAIAPAKFAHKAVKRNHAPYFKCKGSADDWLKVSEPCVLVQRTTAKEQTRRLIAAELPAAFVKRHGAVVIENHLNMIRPIEGKSSAVGTTALTRFLNSSIVDTAFRCISGSVAVSAFELEALPLPSSDQMERLEELIDSNAKPEKIEEFIRTLYLGEARE